MNVPTLWMPCPACQGRGSAMDLLGSTVTCPVCGGTGRIQRRVRRVHFDYAFPIFGFPAAGGTQQQQLQLDSDAYFELTAWALGISPPATQPSASFITASTIQIVDQSTGWQFMNNPVALANFASGNQIPGTTPSTWFIGSGSRFPFPLVAPYVMKPGSQLLATIVWPATPLPDFVQLSMKGYKIYPANGQALPQQQVAA